MSIPVKRDGFPGTRGAVGAPVVRKDAAAKILGEARYVDDPVYPGMLHGATVRTRVIDFALDDGADTTLSPVVLSRGVIHAPGPYACANARVRGRAVATNHPPNGAFRGFGAPQSIFAIDRALVERALASDRSQIDDIRSTDAYRRQVAVNLVTAALAEAWQAPERLPPL